MKRLNIVLDQQATFMPHSYMVFHYMTNLGIILDHYIDRNFVIVGSMELKQ